MELKTLFHLVIWEPVRPVGQKVFPETDAYVDKEVP
jgi:hypothetical protein